MSQTEALMMRVWAKAAALTLLLQQLALPVTAQGIGKYLRRKPYHDQKKKKKSKSDLIIGSLYGLFGKIFIYLHIITMFFRDLAAIYHLFSQSDATTT